MNIPIGSATVDGHNRTILQRVTQQNGVKQRNIVIVILLLTIGAGIGFFAAQKFEQRKARTAAMAAEAQYQQIIQNKDTAIADLQLCIENRARQVADYTQPYNYKTFGINSELFVGKEVEVIEYRYCEATVYSKLIRLDEQTVRVIHYNYDPYTGIHGHSFSFSNEFASILGDNTRMSNYEFRDIPVFHGYENNSLSAFFISKIVQDWTTDQAYTNKHDLHFFYTSDYSPRSLTGVRAQLYSPTSPLAGGIFVELYQPVYPEETEETASQKGYYEELVKDAQANLAQLADAITIEY